MTKHTQKIILVALVLIIGGLLYFTAAGNPFTKRDDASQKNIGASPGATSSPTICYLKRTTTPTGKDDIALSLVFFKDNTITGELNLLPAEKDNMTGTLTGTWAISGTSTRIVTTNHSYKAEGLSGNQPVSFKVSPEIAELSWDKGKTYPQSLTRVSCNRL